MDSASYVVSFSPIAEQHLDSFGKNEIKKILKLAERMESHPTAGASTLKHLKPGVTVWRKRLGDIRVLFTVDTKSREVIVRGIFWRRDAYDDLENLL